MAARQHDSTTDRSWAARDARTFCGLLQNTIHTTYADHRITITQRSTHILSINQHCSISALQTQEATCGLVDAATAAAFLSRRR